MATNRDLCAQSDLPIPPGELLEEELATVGMTPQQLAFKTGLPLGLITEIMRGRASITDEIAREIERVLDIPAQLWVNLEAQYQSATARNLKVSQRLG